MIRAIEEGFIQYVDKAKVVAAVWGGISFLLTRDSVTRFFTPFFPLFLPAFYSHVFSHIWFKFLGDIGMWSKSPRCSNEVVSRNF